MDIAVDREVVSVRANRGVGTSLASWTAGYVAVFVLALRLPQCWFQAPKGSATGASAQATSGLVGLVLLAVLAFCVANLGWAVVNLVTLALREPLLLTFVGLAVGSTLWSADWATTTRDSIALLVVTLIGYWLVLTFTLPQVLAIGGVVLGGAAVLNVAFVFALPQFGQGPSGSWVGLTEHENLLGRQSVFAILVLIFCSRAYLRARWLCYLLIAVAFVNLVMSTSKTGLAGLGAIVGLLFIAVGFRGRRTLYGAVATCFVGAILGGTWLVGAQLDSVTAALGKSSTLTGRTDLWEVSIRAAAERFWFGYGYHGFWNGWLSPGGDVWSYTGWEAPNSHNGLIEAFLWLGVVGAVIVVALFLRTGVRSARTIQLRPGFESLWPLAHLMLATVYSLTESGVFGRTALYLYFVVAIAAVSFARREDYRAMNAATDVDQSSGPTAPHARQGSPLAEAGPG